MAGDKIKMNGLLKKSLFWDVNIDALSLEKDWFFIWDKVKEFFPDKVNEFEDAFNKICRVS